MCREWCNIKLSNSKILRICGKTDPKASGTPGGGPQWISFPIFLAETYFMDWKSGKYIHRNNIMAYCCNVQTSCTFSSHLTKFNDRALSKVNRHKEGTDFCQ